MTARLTRIDGPISAGPISARPDFCPTRLRPSFARLAAVRAGMAARGRDALVVCGDRDDAATIRWLTGFDLRVEEAVLVVTPVAALPVAAAAI